MARAGCALEHCVNNPHFYFRKKEQPAAPPEPEPEPEPEPVLEPPPPEPIVEAPVPLSHEVTSVLRGEWNIHNSGGSNFRLDHNPQYIVNIKQGTKRTTKLGITLEHTGELKMSPMLFYVYDIDRYLTTHAHHLKDMQSYRYEIFSNRDQVDEVFKSPLSKINQKMVQGTVKLSFGEGDKNVLVVPCAGLEGRVGAFQLRVQCLDKEPREINLLPIRDFKFKHVQTVNGSWIKGVAGGEIGSPLFSYNPCYEIKIEQNDTCFMCVLHEYDGIASAENIRPRIALFLFEYSACKMSNEGHEHHFTKEHLKSLCKWVSPTKVLLSGVASPEAFQDHSFTTRYYLVCSTYEEGLEANFQLKVYSTKQLKVIPHNL